MHVALMQFVGKLALIYCKKIIIIKEEDIAKFLAHVLGRQPLVLLETKRIYRKFGDCLSGFTESVRC